MFNYYENISFPLNHFFSVQRVTGIRRVEWKYIELKIKLNKTKQNHN